MHIPKTRGRVSNRGIMENKQIRRANLLLLIDETESKTLRELADLCGVSENYLSQVKSPKIARQMGDDVARRLERGMKKPPGWMDVQQNGRTRGRKPLAAEEWELIDAYRECSIEGQETIFALCQQLRGKPKSSS